MDIQPGSRVAHRRRPDRAGTVVMVTAEKARIRWDDGARPSMVRIGFLRPIGPSTTDRADLVPLRAILLAALRSAVDWERRGSPWLSLPTLIRCLDAIGWT